MNHRALFRKAFILLAAFLTIAGAGMAKESGSLPDFGAAPLVSAALRWAPPEGWSDPRFGDSFQAEITDRERLSKLETLISQAYPIKGGAGCPFYGACILKLKTHDGQQLELEMAWDSCSIFRFGGHDYNYKPLEFRERYDVYPNNDVLFDLFTWQEKARNLDHNSLPAIGGLYRDWLSIHGQPWLWSFETWVRFTQTFEPLAQGFVRLNPNQPRPGWLRLMRQHYTWNEKNDLSLNDAMSIATEAVRDQFGLSREEMWEYTAYTRFVRASPEQGLWLVHYLQGENPQGAPYVRLDAKTGQVLDIGRWPEEIGQDISFME